MVLDRLPADRQLVGDLFVREPARDTVEDLNLARGQRREQRRSLLILGRGQLTELVQHASGHMWLGESALGFADHFQLADFFQTPANTLPKERVIVDNEHTSSCGHSIPFGSY